MARLLAFGRMNSLLLTSPLLQSSVLSPQYWPFSLDWIPNTAYLVGGCVRDALLEYASPYLDLDFVMPQDPIQTAQAIAHHYRAGFVVLDAQRQIARVVFENATADFALQVGNSLVEDLERRDFTINAIAYSPHTQALVDPLGGRKDLAQRTLRMVCAENLKDDPLRLMRAYRQAAQLNFCVDSKTRIQLHALAPLLSSVAPERIRVELSYLLSHAKGTQWLTELWRDGLLGQSFVHATAEGLALIGRMDCTEAEVTARWAQLESLLHRTLSDRPKSGEGVRRTLFATAKLVGLVDPDPQVAKQTLQAMKYSKAEIALVLTVLQGLIQLRQNLTQGALSRRQQYLLFRMVRDAFPALAVVALAAGISLADIAPLVDEYLDGESAIAHPKPLVSGQVLMGTLSLGSGPLVGQLLAALELAHAEGSINTATEAIRMAQQMLLLDSVPRSINP
jgi:tRNA nucleotidyltransferase (CCA-adding enzyme)